MNEKFKLLALQAQMGTADFDAGSFYVATLWKIWWCPTNETVAL